MNFRYFMLDSGYSMLVAGYSWFVTRGSKIKTPVFVFNYPSSLRNYAEVNAEVSASVFAPEGLRRDTR